MCNSRGRWQGWVVAAAAMAAVGTGRPASAGVITYAADIDHDSFAPQFRFEAPQFNPALFAPDPAQVVLLRVDIAYRFRLIDDLYLTYDGPPGDVGTADLAITRPFTLQSDGLLVSGTGPGTAETIELEAGTVDDRRTYAVDVAGVLSGGADPGVIGTGVLVGWGEYEGTFDLTPRSGAGTFALDVGDTFFSGPEVTVTYTYAVVPEPAALALAGLGGLGLVVRAARTRRPTAAA